MIAIGVFCAVVAAIGIYVAVGSDAIPVGPRTGVIPPTRGSPITGIPEGPGRKSDLHRSLGCRVDRHDRREQAPGTSAWRIAPGVAPGFIEGFADHTYASRANRSASTSRRAPPIHGHRLPDGWYQGNGARQIWQSADVDGVAQPPCPVDTTVNMVSCDNWSKSLSLTIPTTFPPATTSSSSSGVVASRGTSC